MAFNYPISAPTDPSPSKINLRYKNIAAETTSPYTLEQQIHEFQGGLFFADITVPSMNRTNAEKWEAFLTRLKGKVGSFTISYPPGDTPKGSANGSPEVAPVANPPYVSFDGSSDYINIGDNLDVTGSFTWEMWIYPRDISTSDQRLFVKHDTSSSEGWYLSVGDGGKGELRSFVEGLSPGQRDTGNVLTKDEWQHVAVVYDTSAETHTIYVNGVQEAQDTGVTGDPVDNSAKLGIGGDPDDNSGNSFNGYIDDVRFWHGTRTQKEIKDNLNNELTGSETDLAGYWKLDDSSGDASDSVASNSGTLSGASWVPLTDEILMITGWNADQTNALNAGDYIEVNSEFKKVVEDVDSDARGNSTVFIQPSFRNNPPKNESVITNDPQLKLRLQKNDIEWEVESIVHQEITFPCREAF